MPDDLTQLIPHLRGRFVVFEGPDGSGKSTQLRRFTDACRASGLEPCEVREPGGTDIGERIRAVLLEHGEEPMDLRCEMLLYMASRAQLVDRRVLPALDANEFVLADRFVSSTIAYQGHAGGLPLEDIHAVTRIAVGRAMPDLVVIFDVDERTAAARMNPLLRGEGIDRMEAKGRAFHRKVREGYRQQAEDDPAHVALIDAARSEDEVWASLIETLTLRLTGSPG